ncbi:MAG: beta-galactosidase, partial [Ignavibacteriae bacterium]|nr:beta-galactosidase [Ignavibacteriota bacterium]
MLSYLLNSFLSNFKVIKILKVILIISPVLLISIPTLAQEPTHTFEIGKENFMLDGKPFQIRCGELHFARIPKDYWRHRIQMMKAMGMNTICAYIFWNFHERTPGEFKWDGEADVAQFCKIAQEEGLWVILRPGPYACAEWEMGGLPWWLLKNENISLRTKDPLYINAAQKYLAEVGKVLSPLQITKGGPIIMVQVENEYGFFADDAEYMGLMRSAILDAGFKVPLFDCNPPYHLKKGLRDDLFHVVNFGSNPEPSFKALREILPQGPLMCGEFYSGWFDTWGNPHTFGETEQYLKDMEYMLKTGASFSIYMAHGGTTFGFWAGADRPFKPDVSSYDYGAPVSEAGWTTEKFFATRELISKYLLPDEPKIPDPPALNPTTTFPKISLTQFAPIFKNLPKPIVTENPKTMEYYNQSRGSILYRTTLPAGSECKLSVDAVHDFGWVFVDGEKLGVIDRRKQNYRMTIPERKNDAVIDILVHAMGRINFGPEVHDRKGLIGEIKFTDVSNNLIQVNDWQIFNLAYQDDYLNNIIFEETNTKSNMPGIWKGQINIENIGDVFLDVSKWGKGYVWINGNCLGKYWNIGPTQTMYIPAPWLKKSTNEILVLDLLGPEDPILQGLEKPILNELHPEKDFTLSKRKDVILNINSIEAVQTGSFLNSEDMQTVEFPNSVNGRYFCIEILSSYSKTNEAGIAELDLLDKSGMLISHQNWTIAYVTSEELISENGSAENAIDGQTFNYWHSAKKDKTKFPYFLVIDLHENVDISGLRYVPISGKNIGSKIKSYKIYIGNSI